MVICFQYSAIHLKNTTKVCYKHFYELYNCLNFAFQLQLYQLQTIGLKFQRHRFLALD